MIKFATTIAFQHDSIFSPFKPTEFDAAINWAAEAGLDGVELVISDYSDQSPGALLKLRRRLDDCGLLVATISTGGAYFREGLSLTSPEAEIRARARQRIFEHIDAAEILGSKVTIGLLRGVGSKSMQNEERQWLAEQLVEIDARASKLSVGVLLEAINRYEVRLLNSLSETVDFIKAMAGTTSLKVLWDVFHANIEDRAFGDEIVRHGQHIGHVHFADNNRSFPGFGKFDFQEILVSLVRHGFDGFVSLECLTAPDVDTVRRGMKEFVRQSRECVTGAFR